MNIKSRKLRGMSLIELMIAMVIGLLLLGGAISMFITNKRVYQEQNEMGLLQENARFAMGLLIDDIRMAGYIGCHDNIDMLNTILNDSSILDFKLSDGKENIIEGSESAANWVPSSSTNNVSDMLAGSDAITIRYIKPVGTSNPGSSPALIVKPESNIQISVTDILAISDCDSADIFQITAATPDAAANTIEIKHAVSGSPGNRVNTLQKNYQTSAAISHVIARRYYIAKRKDNAGNRTGPPALYWSDFLGSKELVEGVDNMQILYGVDTSGNGTPNSYLNATAVTDWTAVISVRIALLMRTVEEYGTIIDTGTYSLLGTIIDPTDDRHRRRVFTTTIQIRNSSNGSSN